MVQFITFFPESTVHLFLNIFPRMLTFIVSFLGCTCLAVCVCVCSAFSMNLHSCSFDILLLSFFRSFNLTVVNKKHNGQFFVSKIRIHNNMVITNLSCSDAHRVFIYCFCNILMEGCCTNTTCPSFYLYWML